MDCENVGDNWPTLLRRCASLWDQTARYRFLSMHYAASFEREVPHEHRQLMNAALVKDIDAVRAVGALPDNY
nr:MULTISPECIES: FCD domain-containing protein [unclassified Pseudomonas]